MMPRTLFALLFMFGLVTLAGCGKEQACVPGSTQACLCPAGSSAQACNAQGTGYEPCQCAKAQNAAEPSGTQEQKAAVPSGVEAQKAAEPSGVEAQCRQMFKNVKMLWGDKRSLGADYPGSENIKKCVADAADPAMGAYLACMIGASTQDDLEKCPDHPDKQRRRDKTKEAIDQIDKIYKGAARYYSTPHTDQYGERLPCQFPRSQGITPVEATCCSTGGQGGPDTNGDGRCDPDPNLWMGDVWAALNFRMLGESYFTYAFTTSGTGPDAMFTITGNADLDCDGTQSTFQRMGYADPSALRAGECRLKRQAAFYVERETE